ncbi:putative leucine-rich repeat domain superfamily, F-box-like domain superfamily [Helianthus annuus]|nr:putative leucine-rich repeat domain superfamily, F-box-like domain superfamily [Helianthus annuus]KAJ0644991.1 putative leucine-rich repeat domain superfamily, F-box-like domain superfamily [Helianthus annuus]KAJ0681849.1 putative leucine-rich repeat domain superfamily, F-box-like domain superfamily [Helianthus annuus]
MDSLPDAVVQYILSTINNAKDVASCNCVSKKWKDSMPYVKSLYFPRGVFDHLKNGQTSDCIVMQMVSSTFQLEDLVVYCPFTGSGLASWLSVVGPSLKNLELRMDNFVDQDTTQDTPSKLECIQAARNLESLRLWGVLMVDAPKWDAFQKLQNLEIVGAKFEDSALAEALRATPNLTRLVLLRCEGLRTVWIKLDRLEHCKLDFDCAGSCSLTLTAPNIEYLEVQGCSLIRVRETNRLKNLSLANNDGRVYMVDFGKLPALESLSIRGVQWCWDAINKLLQLASEVKHLYMKVEFTGDFEALLPFPEIDFVDFFKSHPKLKTFDIHGAMFAALCQKNSLKNVSSKSNAFTYYKTRILVQENQEFIFFFSIFQVDSSFRIPCLEEVAITVRSPLNAEQKMNTLESLVKFGKNLKKLKIKILGMKSGHSSADDFFEEICMLRYMNPRLVSIE